MSEESDCGNSQNAEACGDCLACAREQIDSLLLERKSLLAEVRQLRREAAEDDARHDAMAAEYADELHGRMIAEAEAALLKDRLAEVQKAWRADSDQATRYIQICNDAAVVANSQVEAFNAVVPFPAIPTEDDLVDALRPHGMEIREANEWRPLARHVAGLIRGVLKGLLVRADEEGL